MALVELDNLSYRYGTSIYAVDRVNGTMYGKFSIGYRMIPERATVIPQFQHTSVEDEYEPAYENTLPGVTNIATPITKSTPVTQASHVPITKMILDRDIMRPMSSEGARAAYLKSQIKVPSMEQETDLTRRINMFCNEQREKRRQEWESHRKALAVMKQNKLKQPEKRKEKLSTLR